ncbi:MAG: enoyl-CoA hydratase-related protein [Gemmatimonadaceae bacterium]|nr:enoyl-CoA hydratase-related protein [Gemmatimonadaceae bacterium]
MAYQTLLFERADRIATITVNRPDKLNALNATVIRELGLAIDACRADDTIGGILLTGAGRAFVAGADISELSGLSAAAARDVALAGQAVFRRFESSPKPVVAAINGFAFGGGCELAMACHLRIAAEGAKLGQPEAKLGLLPGYGGTQRLPRLVGRAKALEMLLTAQPVDAAEALRIGLVNRVVAGAELLDVSRALLQQILANGPLAVAGCLALVDQGEALPLEAALAFEAAEFGAMFATADAVEGTRAFLEKRAPTFTGR